jgi:tetratricopeptide (TPR) repeat protein
MKSLGKKSIAIILGCATLFLCSCERNPQAAKAKYFAEGQKYMKKGRYGDAAIEFRNALRLDPRFVDAYYQLAQADLAQHDWSSAYASLEKAIELDPTRLDARLDRGRLYLAARQFDNAEEEANFILKQQPNEVGAYQLLGAALIGEQKPDKALAAFTKVTALRPNDPSAWVNLALVEISLRRVADAGQHFEKAVTVDPKSIQARVDLANFYGLQNQAPQAEQVLRDGIAKSPDSTPIYIQLTSILVSEGKTADAEAVLDALRNQLPKAAGAAMAIGDFYFERKETDQALAEYRRGQSLDPKNIEIQKRIQDVYLTTGQVQAATDLDKQLLKEAPKDIFVRIDHGRLLMAQGNPLDASTYLQQVVADAAGTPQAHYYLAMAYWQDGNLERAHGALLDALRASQGFPPALQALARLSLQRRNSADAQIYAQELVQQFPADPEDRQLLAEALGRQGKLQPAEEQLLTAKHIAPNAAGPNLMLAELYAAEKKGAEAQKEFETALELDPHNTVVLGQMADFLASRNESAEAFAVVQKYISDNPNNASGHVILGSLDFHSKKYPAAQGEFERAIQLDPKDVQPYMRLGKVFEEQGQPDAALASYQNALNLQPKFPALDTYIGNLYLAKGDLETARKYYALALSYDPNFAVAIANTAWVDTKEGKDLDVALGMAQKAKSIEPDVPSITDTLAWVQYKRDDYSDAVHLLNDCVHKVPSSGEFRYHLGMALLGEGEKHEAKENLEAALRLKLNNEEAQKARQALAQLKLSLN